MLSRLVGGLAGGVEIAKILDLKASRLPYRSSGMGRCEDQENSATSNGY
jgi:hypothetical protein